jgi:hypothetical protein
MKRLWGLLFMALLASAICLLGWEEVRAESSRTVPFYHLSKVKGGEFYTTDIAEKNQMVKVHGYADMGIACYILSPEDVYTSDLVPLYRLKYTGDYDGTAFNEYFYTTDRNEVDSYRNKSGWVLEGISGYVLDKNSSEADTVPLYRWYSPSAYHWHGYSTDINDPWITKIHQGVQYEGIACRVWTKQCNVKIPSLYLAAPYNLKAENSGPRVRLTWNGARDSDIDIIIERKTSSSSYRTIATVEAGVNRYIDDSVSPDTYYTYRVRARKDGQLSEPSNEVRIRTDYKYYDDYDYDYRDDRYKDYREWNHGGLWREIIGETSCNLRVTVLSYSKVRLTWDRGSIPTLGYRIERRSNSGSYVTVANLRLGDCSFIDSGLDRDTRYYYRVWAYNLLGDSYCSETVSVCTGSYYRESDDDWWSNRYYDEDDSVVIKLKVGSPTYYCNQALRTMDTAPFILSDRTFVPIRFLAESIGADVDWNDYERKATISRDGDVIELWAGRNTARVNGLREHIDSSNSLLTPIIKSGRIMLPLRFVTENLGFDVYWNNTSKEIVLTYLP